MARERIFVGSSAERRALAERIVAALQASSFQPVPWWESFPAGSTTIDRLLELPHEVDGAVFVFTGDDQLESRESVQPSPRDNVVLEWALFAATLGKPLTMMVVDKNVKLPTDVVGLNYQPLADAVDKTPESVARHFERLFSRRPDTFTGAERVLIDHDTLGRVMSSDVPVSWHARLLYLGTEGGKSWQALSADFAYQAEERRAWFRKALNGIVPTVKIRTLVSLGPGDALLDRDFVVMLRDENPRLAYVPVDISDYLLHNALMQLSAHVKIPTGILSDFEDRMGWLGPEIRRVSPSPYLWVLVGNTLGNLDAGEGHFLRGLRLELTEHDSVLLGLSSQGPEWRLERDSRASLEGYDHRYRAFLAGGISRRTGETRTDVARTFDERVEITCEEVSDVPGAASLVLRDRAGGRRLARITRYRPEPFLEWLQKQGFTVEGHFLRERPEATAVVGDLLVLARKVG